MPRYATKKSNTFKHRLPIVSQARSKSESQGKGKRKVRQKLNTKRSASKPSLTAAITFDGFKGFSNHRSGRHSANIVADSEDVDDDGDEATGKNVDIPVEVEPQRANSRRKLLRRSVKKRHLALGKNFPKKAASTTAPPQSKSKAPLSTDLQCRDSLTITILVQVHKRRRSLSKKARPTNYNRLASLRARKPAQNLPQQRRGGKNTVRVEPNSAKQKAASNRLDAATLNRIEILEVEEKKPTTKRKRINSLNIPISFRKRATRKRHKSTPAAASLEQEKFNVAGNIDTIAQALSIPPPSVVEDKICEDLGGDMSLYERRYQTDDGRGIMPNGYLNTTRSTSATSSILHSDTDAQDVSNQYYIPSAGPAANATLNNAGAINHAASMATLCNIGNSCYLNSVIYTLRFAPQFLHNLHHLIIDLSSIQQKIVRQRAKTSSLGRGVTAAQMESGRSSSTKDLIALEQNSTTALACSSSSLLQKSSHQLMTERLHELYQSLHRNEVTDSMEPFHADILLRAIQDVNATFEGNQQQDAHEFLMCLLNSIRETCQTLKKAIAECPDVIVNGYISTADNTRFTNENDSNVASSHASNSGNSLSSLATSNITKASFFSRKSKRKDEQKNSKNSRLHSPLKDSGNSGVQQVTSNSLFYLNTVDLSGSGGSGSGSGGGGGGTYSPPLNSASPTAAIMAKRNAGGGDDEPSATLLKDKEKLEEKIRELGLDFFSEDFEGITVATTKCLSCETITEQKESMIDIAVPVPISGYDSSDYTEKPCSFIQNSCITREYFRGENKYRCEQCTGYTEAIRSISYEVLPRLLVIQLSRFSGGMEKISSYIPTSFTLQCFCAKCCELSEGNKLHIYKLYSVITHVGATMTVGHYIAYTSSLDWANEYMNCPKDRRASQQQDLQQKQQLQQQLGSQSSGSQNNGINIVGTQSSERSSSSQSGAASLMKKMKFGRSKASSSGDMSKSVKNINGITSKAITNGIGKLSINTTCHSLSCCATRLTNIQQQQQQQQQHQQQHASNSDLNDDGIQNGSSHSNSTSTSSSFNFSSGYGSIGRGGNKNYYPPYGNASQNANSEQIWYMCDDDKIKAMTQREFEDLLSPTRKITITPYLLFYARFDLQPTQATPPRQSTPHNSWSNESLQSGAHSKI